MPSIAVAKAPLVMFDYREYGLDAEKSEKAGKPVPLTLPFAIITTDKFTTFEKPAEEWLEQKRRAAIDGRENPDWVKRWEMQFEAWKKGEELPPDGVPIKTWASLNREQINRLIALGYVTVEQLSQVPDTNLATIGLDGRYLRDLARAYLERAEVDGQNKKIADQEQTIRDQKKTIDLLMERVAALEQAQPAKPQRETLSMPGKGK